MSSGMFRPITQSNLPALARSVELRVLMPAIENSYKSRNSTTWPAWQRDYITHYRQLQAQDRSPQLSKLVLDDGGA